MNPAAACLEDMPHLFHQARIPTTSVGEQGGRLVGVVGLYPIKSAFGTWSLTWPAWSGGHPAGGARRRGDEKHFARGKQSCGFVRLSWLHGDRQRYGRYGWELGGVHHVFETFDKYLPTRLLSGRCGRLTLGPWSRN